MTRPFGDSPLGLVFYWAGEAGISFLLAFCAALARGNPDVASIEVGLKWLQWAATMFCIFESVMLVLMLFTALLVGIGNGWRALVSARPE